MKKILVCLSQIVLVLILSTMVYGAQDSNNEAQEFFKTERLYVDGFCLLGPNAISGGTAQYSNVKVDENSITIILENSHMENVGSSTWEGFITYWGDRTLNIVIKGNNTMSTSKYDQCCYLNGGIYVSSIEKKGNVNVNITGDGTLNLENGGYLIRAEDSNINVSIEGATIHSNFAGIYCGGTFSVKNSKIFIKNSLDEQPHLPAGRSNALVCSKYDFDNEHIYVGKGKLEKEINSEELFEKMNIKDMEMCQNKLDYDWVLLSDEVADLRDYNPVLDTTSVKAPGKAIIKKITAKKKATKKVKLLLKKIRGAKGYQVAIYKTKKNAAKNKKAIVKKFVKKTRATVSSKKLKNKKTLYVKVRAYKLNGKKKIYGKWSKAKKVKIKK
ncbi:MAG: hypothetical protein HFG28_03610 [Eubacterium sp.]|nr:hypothetical protein [Eubacterium sp.]